jgi:hypothetical protein
MGNRIKSKSINEEVNLKTIENIFKKIFKIDVQDKHKHIITNKNIYDDEISKLLHTKVNDNLNIHDLKVSNYTDNIILQYFRTVFCFTEVKSFADSFWHGLGNLTNTSDQDISAIFFKKETKTEHPDVLFLNLIDIFTKIFYYKDKELRLLYYLFDDVVYYYYLTLMCLFDKEILKGFNSFTFAVIIFEKKRSYTCEELIYVRNAYFLNVLTFMLFKRATESGFKKCNLMFIDFENSLAKKELKLQDKSIVDRLYKELKDIEEFNNMIIQIFIYLTSNIQGMSILFTLDMITISKYFKSMDLAEIKRTNKKLYFIDNDKDVLLSFLQTFSFNKKTLIEQIRTKNNFDEITILLNQATVIFILLPGSKELNINISFKTITEMSNQNWEKVLNSFSENFLEFVSEVLQYANKIVINIDSQMNSYLKKCSTQLDLLNREESILKRCKIEFYIDGVRKSFLEDFLKDELVIDTDILYLLNTDRRRSVYTFLTEKLLKLCVENIVELKYIKERFNFIVDNMHLQEKEYTARNIYNTLNISRNRCLEDEIFLNSSKIVDNKVIQKIFKVSLIHSLLNSTIINTDEIIIVHGIFMKNYNNLQIKLKLNDNPNLPIKEILGEIFHTSKGCGLILLLINANFTLAYHNCVNETINFLIKQYYTLYDNEIFCCLFNNDNFYTINLHIFSRVENINEERKKSDFINISIHLTNLPDDQLLSQELFTCLEIINNALARHFSKRNYFCLNYLFYNRKKVKSKPILQFSIVTGKLNKELYINYIGFKKKIKNILKFNLINKCLSSICDKDISQCNRLNLNLNKYLVKNNQNYINTINILFQNKYISSSLKQSVINVNNSNIQLLSRAFQNNFVRENFIVGTIKLLDANIYDTITSVYQNDYILENLEIIFEKNLNGMVSFEKIIAFNSNNLKKDKLNNLISLKRRRKNKIIIHFNHSTHAEFIQEVYLMSNFIKFLKTFFDFIVLKGKAFADIGKELENCKYRRIFYFENKFVQDPIGLYLALRKYFMLYREKKIMTAIMKAVSVRRNIQIELHNTKVSNLVFN